MKYLPYHSIFFAPKRGAWNHQAQESGDGHWWWLWWHRDTNVGWQMGRAVRWFRVRRWNEGRQGDTFWDIWETDQWLLERDWGCLLYPPVNRCRQWKILSSMRKIDTAWYSYKLLKSWGFSIATSEEDQQQLWKLLWHHLPKVHRHVAICYSSQQFWTLRSIKCFIDHKVDPSEKKLRKVADVDFLNHV